MKVAAATSDEAVTVAQVKKSAAVPAALEMTSSLEDVDAHPQEVPVPSPGLTPPTPRLAGLLRTTSLQSPRSFLRLRFLLPWCRGRLLLCPARG